MIDFAPGTEIIAHATAAKGRPESYIVVDENRVPTAYIGKQAVAFFRLRMIYNGLAFEVKCPGMRLTNKAPKCSTLVKREFGLKGNPAKLLAQMTELMKDLGNPEVHGVTVMTREQEKAM